MGIGIFGDIVVTENAQFSLTPLHLKNAYRLPSMGFLPHSPAPTPKNYVMTSLLPSQLRLYFCQKRWSVVASPPGLSGWGREGLGRGETVLDMGIHVGCQEADRQLVITTNGTFACQTCCVSSRLFLCRFYSRQGQAVHLFSVVLFRQLVSNVQAAV